MDFFDKVAKGEVYANQDPQMEIIDGFLARGLFTKKDILTFEDIPVTLEEFKALPEYSCTTPYQPAALYVLALCHFPYNRDLSVSMINSLMGPDSLHVNDVKFMSDRLMDKKYLPQSYILGATPENEYKPPKPYRICVLENANSKQSEDSLMLFLPSGGADTPRPIYVRQHHSGRWCYISNQIMSGIRVPHSQDPWKREL